MTFQNVYADATRAEAYSRLDFPGTYFLAFRDLPEILGRHVTGRRAVDFGCGAGRSTRFVRRLGFDAVGVDISEDMVRKAREIDPAGATTARLRGAGRPRLSRRRSLGPRTLGVHVRQRPPGRQGRTPERPRPPAGAARGES